MVHYPIVPYAAPTSFLSSGIAALAGAGGFVARQGVVDTARYIGERVDDLAYGIRRWTGPYLRADRTIRSLANTYAGRALLPSYSRTSRPARRARNTRTSRARSFPSRTTRSSVMPYRRTLKSFGRGRKRARFAPRLKRRGRMMSSGLRKYSTMRTTSRTLRCESVHAAVLISQSSGMVGTNAYSFPAQYLQIQCITAASDGITVGAANTYVIIGSMAHLFSANGAFASTLSQMYEFVKCTKLTLRLYCPFNPRTQLTEAVPTSNTQLNLAYLPVMDSNISWIERDGNLALDASVMGFIPTNGDTTQFVRSRPSARSHPAFRNIVRTCVPNVLTPTLSYNASNGSYLQPLAANSSAAVEARSPWVYCNSSTAQGWYGFGISFAYQGPKGTANAQPTLSYTAEMDYELHFKGQLF